MRNLGHVLIEGEEYEFRKVPNPQYADLYIKPGIEKFLNLVPYGEQ